jgi:hypothetical protein
MFSRPSLKIECLRTPQFVAHQHARRTAVATLAADLLAEGLMIRISVGGGSMAPTLNSGDVVTIAPASAGDVRAGHIVLVQDAAGLLVLHRCVATAPALILHGDALASQDAAVAVDVCGRAIAVTRGGRTSDLTRRRVRLMGRLRAWRLRWRHCRTTWRQRLAPSRAQAKTHARG